MILSKIYGNGMILQRRKKNIIEGISDKNDKISVMITLSMGKSDVSNDAETYEATADENGKWQISVSEHEAGGPYVINISDSNDSVIVYDVWFGDVILLGGQSNMELPVCRTLDLYEKHIEELDFPYIRMFQLPKNFKFGEPDEYLTEGEWISANKGCFGNFSALGFYFAEKKYLDDKIPVGLVHAAVGGTHIEAFMSEKQILSTGRALKIKALKEGRDLVCKCSLNDSCKMCYEKRIEADKNQNYVKGVIEDDLNNMSKWGEQLDRDDIGLAEEWYSHEWSFEEKQDAFYVDVPSSWMNIVLGKVIGSVWVQTSVNVPKDWCEEDVLLRLGTIVDADFTYVNGVLVGRTDYFYPPRRYMIPKGVLKPGKNIITVRVIINNNVGEFKKDMPYYLKKGEETISLEGRWAARISAVEEPMGDSLFFTWQPTSLYNKMIYPIRNLTFDTILFYQGESNTRYPEDYEYLMKDMIGEWRRFFGEIPFIFAELPDFKGESWEKGGDGWDIMRRAQKKVADSVYNTSMVRMYDLGQYNEIHPQNKMAVAERFYEEYVNLVSAKGEEQND